MRFIPYSVLSLFFFLLGANAFSQGCSDPGMCTIGSLNSETTKDTVSGIDYTTAGLESLLSASITREKYRFEVIGLAASGDNHTYISTLVLKGVVRIKDKMLLNLKIPFTHVRGALGTNAGVGDISISLQNTFYSGKNKRATFTAGVIVPTGDANAFDKGFALPMIYQTTLGSFNALVGLSGTYKKWGAAVGYQQSFGTNGNSFNKENLVTDPTQPGYDELNIERTRFASTENFRRGADVFLRLERGFQFTPKWAAVVGVMPIYRINQSKATLAGETEMKIDGTDGLTLNLTGGLKFAPNRNWLFTINCGGPLIVREVRADGLGRNFVGMLSAAYKVW